MALCAECFGQVQVAILLNADLIGGVLEEDAALSKKTRARLALVQQNIQGFAERFWAGEPGDRT